MRGQKSTGIFTIFHIDKFILLGTIICLASSKLALDGIENLTGDEKNLLVAYCCNNFSASLKSIGLRTNNTVRREVNKFLAAVNEEDYTYFNQTEDDREEIIADYRTDNAGDLMTRIRQISARATVEYAEDRHRNSTLISLLKSYYMQCYTENDTLRCECCNEETFITDAGQPYVEFHHLIPFGNVYGPDHYLNLFALCPDCHRKMHYLNLDEKEEHYQNLNNNNHMHLTFVNRLITLKNENLIRTYHLEYLLVDKAISDDEYNEVIAA